MRFSVYPSNPRLVTFFMDEVEFKATFGTNCQYICVSYKDDRIFFTPGTVQTGNKVAWSWHEGTRYCRFGFSPSRLGEPLVPCATSRHIPYEETAEGLAFLADAIRTREGDTPAGATREKGGVAAKIGPAAVPSLPALPPPVAPRPVASKETVRQTADTITDELSAVRWALDMLNGLGEKLGLEYLIRDNRIRAVMRTEL